MKTQISLNTIFLAIQAVHAEIMQLEKIIGKDNCNEASADEMLMLQDYTNAEAELKSAYEELTKDVINYPKYEDLIESVDTKTCPDCSCC